MQSASDDVSLQVLASTISASGARRALQAVQNTNFIGSGWPCLPGAGHGSEVTYLRSSNVEYAI